MDENSPLFVAMKVVAHEKAAAVQKFPQLLRLLIGQSPVTDFDPIDNRPVIDAESAPQLAQPNTKHTRFGSGYAVTLSRG